MVIENCKDVFRGTFSCWGGGGAGGYVWYYKPRNNKKTYPWASSSKKNAKFQIFVDMRLKPLQYCSLICQIGQCNFHATTPLRGILLPFKKSGNFSQARSFCSLTLNLIKVYHCSFFFRVSVTASPHHCLLKVYYHELFWITKFYEQSIAQKNVSHF